MKKFFVILTMFTVLFISSNPSFASSRGKNIEQRLQTLEKHYLNQLFMARADDLTLKLCNCTCATPTTITTSLAFSSSCTVDSDCFVAKYDGSQCSAFCKANNTVAVDGTCLIFN
ncbi:MAG: hypothetical protein HY094_06025 [Candidatus Melainabacteria bacterium]|nr:hypothetical protein [Candidatus Melainabacteria bacterium]